MNPLNSIAEAVRDILYGPRRNRVSFGTVQRTLNRQGLIPFRIHPMQHLTANQKELRFQFVAQMILREQDRDPELFKKVLWTDEATFSTSGMYNRHNVHYWSQVNPRKYKTIKYQGRTSVNVWCGIVNNRIIGPIFFNGSLTGQRYLQFLQNEVENLLDELPLMVSQNLIWQQDGAPPHAVRDVVNFLNYRYNEWIGRNGTMRWPPNSPDITIMDTFLWGHLKNVVYRHRCQNIEEVKIKISNEINRLKRENHILTAGVDRLRRGYRACFENNGGHIEHLNY